MEYKVSKKKYILTVLLTIIGIFVFSYVRFTLGNVFGG